MRSAASVPSGYLDKKQHTRQALPVGALYGILKDFAGPVATVTAASTAVFVTWRIGRTQAAIARQQADIAQQQADTALDRLRFDLFDKRYSI